MLCLLAGQFGTRGATLGPCQAVPVAKKKPSTSDRGVAPRCEALWDALDCSRP